MLSRFKQGRIRGRSLMNNISRLPVKIGERWRHRRFFRRRQEPKWRSRNPVYRADTLRWTFRIGMDGSVAQVGRWRWNSILRLLKRKISTALKKLNDRAKFNQSKSSMKKGQNRRGKISCHEGEIFRLKINDRRRLFYKQKYHFSKRKGWKNIFLIKIYRSINARTAGLLRSRGISIWWLGDG